MKALHMLLNFISFLTFSMFLCLNFLYAQGSSLNITEVLVDFDTETISIMGQDLDYGGALIVTLGDLGSLNVSTENPTMIVVDFPAGGLLNGDYLLTVSRGNSPNQNDSYDLTIIESGIGNGPPACPIDYRPLNDKICIEISSNDRPRATWYSANYACLEENARLCTIGEWVYACQRNFITPLLYRSEWVDGAVGNEGIGSEGLPKFIAIATVSCKGIYGLNGEEQDDARFRCCMDR